MGILDGLIGQLLGSGENSNIATFLAWIQNEGGIASLLSRIKTLEEKGLYREDFTAEHIGSLFQGGELISLAQKMGLSESDVIDWVKEHLPLLLKHLSQDPGTQV